MNDFCENGETVCIVETVRSWVVTVRIAEHGRIVRKVRTAKTSGFVGVT